MVKTYVIQYIIESDDDWDTVKDRLPTDAKHRHVFLVDDMTDELIEKSTEILQTVYPYKGAFNREITKQEELDSLLFLLQTAIESTKGYAHNHVANLHDVSPTSSLYKLARLCSPYNEANARLPQDIIDYLVHNIDNS